MFENSLSKISRVIVFMGFWENILLLLFLLAHLIFLLLLYIVDAYLKLTIGHAKR